MKTHAKTMKLIRIAMVLLLITTMLALTMQTAYAAHSVPELDYTFETVPIETIKIIPDATVKEYQPRQSFTVSYEVTPWYTTSSEVYFDILPNSAATVTEVTKIKVSNGTATGKAKVTVSENAVVGSKFCVIAGADGVESNKLEFGIGKVPVKGLKLNLDDTDDKLHVGKSRSLTCEFTPSYATIQDVRYEMSGNGTKYIESLNSSTGVIKAKDNISVLDVNSTVTITAYSIDNPNAFDSVTLTLYMPTTTVLLSASTPLGRVTFDNKPLAVANSVFGDTVQLHTKVNNVDTTGLNYIIVEGQEYVENGYVQTGGTMNLRPTSSWTEEMKLPHPEIKVRVFYSDGFDEIVISIYIPVERIEFVNDISTEVENYRSYDLRVEAFPKYATLLADNQVPINYSLNGIDESIATIDGDGMLVLPKSLTSKGNIINYSANLSNAWDGVDVLPLKQNIRILPVYASGFKSVKILKDGKLINSSDDSIVKPSDVLSVKVEYIEDNVTDIDFAISESSEMLSVIGEQINVEELSTMTADNPCLDINVTYNNGGKNFNEILSISIYVPAMSAEIKDEIFRRYESIDLNKLVTINSHGYASNKTIEWGQPIVSNSTKNVTATCDRGVLRIDSFATAGTIVRVPYKTFDREDWQFKEFKVAALNNDFELTFDKTSNSVDGRQYAIDMSNPQLEEGQSVNFVLKFKGTSGMVDYGLTYTVKCSNNAKFVYVGGNKAYDTFKLTANSGESGIGNNIGFVITIQDGDEVYCIRSAGFEKPSSVSMDITTKSFAIFNRINGNIGVANNKVYINDLFELNGWDNLATFDKDNLKFIVNGKELSDRKMIETSGPFILKITASQLYNGQEIAWSAEIGYSVIYYKDGDEIKLKVYKKTNSSITIEGQNAISKANYTLTGWATNSAANKLSSYKFGSNYSGNDDITLWACWRKSAGENVAGNILYDGEKFKCSYDVRIGSKSVDGNNINKEGFYVNMLGIHCNRNIFTTFTYIIEFKLSRNGTECASKSVKFKISDKDDVPGDVRGIFNADNIPGEGDYTLSWSGRIESNVDVNVSGSYDFKINLC